MMETTRFARCGLLASGIAGAFLVSLAAAPANAACGYTMTEHPLRGHFPVASGEPAPLASTHSAAADATPVAVAPRARTAKRGDWLRGDFPRAVAANPNPVRLTRVADGVELTADLQIPGSGMLRIEELTFQPGAAFDTDTMETAFICEMLAGELQAVVDVAFVQRSDGDVWPCPREQVSALHTNTGTTPAVMRVFHRIPQ
jgi:hypothetical protein